MLYITERRILHSQPVMNNHSSEKRIATEKVLSSLAHEAALEAIGQSRKSQSNSNSPALSMFNSTSVPSLTYSLGKSYQYIYQLWTFDKVNIYVIYEPVQIFYILTVNIHHFTY